jgi:uncharacterized delta-60 repeat protein
MLVVVGLFLVALSSSGTAWAAPGDPDTSFSGDGFRMLDFPGGHDDLGRAVVVQANGRIVLGGSTETGGTIMDFGLVRLLSGGALDSSFSGDGFRAVDASGENGHDSITDLAVQSDGKIVAVGWAGNATSTSTRFVVVRLKANGTLDTTFSGDGIAYVSFPGYDSSYAWAVAIQGNGKILVGGETGNEGADNWNFAVARLGTGGALDPTYSGDGRTTASFGPNDDGIWDMVLQEDSKLVAGGWARNAADDSGLGVARFKPNGALDTSFSVDGKVRVDFGAGFDSVEGIEVRGDGKIVAAAFVDNGGDQSVGLIRLKSGGGLDTSFSGDGKVLSNPTDQVYVRDLDLGAGNKLLVAAATSDNEIFLARYGPGGALDPTFGGGDGIVLATFPGATTSIPYRSTIQPNGRILLVGYRIAASTDFGAARFLP